MRSTWTEWVPRAGGSGANGGSVSQDPGGYAGTVDPTVNVLRVGLHPRGLAPLIVNLGDRLLLNHSY